MGLFGSNIYIMSIISHRQYNFESLKQYYFGKPCWCVQSHPEDQGDFGQGFNRKYFKGEVRSWSNLISEERVKFSEQNSENLMKIGWKIRKLWTLKFHKFSGNISWPVRMNMQMNELMMSSPHYLPYILYIKFWKF